MRASFFAVFTRLCFLAVAVPVVTVAHAAADFTPLGSLPDPNYFASAPHAVSADGKTITGDSVVFRYGVGDRQAVLWNNGVGPSSLGSIGAGYSNSGSAVSAHGEAIIGQTQTFGAPGDFAFYWSSSGGATVPTVLSGFTNSAANALSADGSTMVGAVYNIGPPWSSSTEWQAVRWTPIEGWFMALGYLPGGSDAYSNANGVSADGSVIVGTSTSANSDYEAFRWTHATGMVGLGFLPSATESYASFVSDDGQVVVGYATFAFDPSQNTVFRWTEATGMVDLGALPGATMTAPTAISRDGRFVVGKSGNEAFRWSEADGMIGLGRLPDAQESGAIAVSNDGSEVLGWSYFSDGHRDYFLWTESAGMRTLRDILTADGVDVTAWQDLQAEAMSQDGNVIVGQGIDPAGSREGWMMRLQGNRAPIATLGWSPQWPIQGTAISFWGTGSSDPDGDEIVSYRWDFGDGTTDDGAVVQHTYTQAGNYTVTLIVNDGRIESAPAIATVAVFQPM